MKRLLNRIGLQRLIVAALAAFASVGMWGCGSGWYRGSVGIPQSAD